MDAILLIVLGNHEVGFHANVVTLFTKGLCDRAAVQFHVVYLLTVGEYNLM